MPAISKITQRGKNGLLGLVLAGGQSLRMGVDKAALTPFGPHGPDMLARAFALVSAFARPAFVASGSGIRKAYPCLRDEVSGFGPVAGIAAGLARACGLGLAGALAIPCDLPLLPPQILRSLLQFQQSRPDMAATFFQDAQSGRLQPLVAVYSVTGLEYLHMALRCGEKSLRKVIPPEKCAIIPYGQELAPYFLNCNRPADVAASREFCSSRE